MPGCAPRLLSREWGEFQPPPPQNDDRITRVRKLEGPHLDAYRDLDRSRAVQEGAEEADSTRRAGVIGPAPGSPVRWVEVVVEPW